MHLSFNSGQDLQKSLLWRSPVTVLFRRNFSGSEKLLYHPLTALFTFMMLHYHNVIVCIAHGCNVGPLNSMGESDKQCRLSNSAAQSKNAVAGKQTIAAAACEQPCPAGI